MTHFVDADHAGNMINCRSHIVILIYFCRAPIIWYIKKQNTVESITFRQEIVGMPTEMDLTKGLRNKLRIIGVPIDRPTLVFCDNKLVVTNTSVPTSALQQKHLGVCYHAIIESFAAIIHWIAYIAGEFNPVDVPTKLLTAAVKRLYIGQILY